jgi:hypothetical protein
MLLILIYLFIHQVSAGLNFNGASAISYRDDRGGNFARGVLTNGLVLNRAVSEYNFVISATTVGGGYSNFTWTCSPNAGEGRVATTSPYWLEAVTLTRSFELGTHWVHVVAGGNGEARNITFTVIYQEFPVVWFVTLPTSRPTVGGFQITLKGEYFINVNCTTTPVVKLGVYPCNIDFVNETLILCTVVNGQGSLNELIITNCGIRNLHPPAWGNNQLLLYKSTILGTLSSAPSSRYCTKITNSYEPLEYAYVLFWFCYSLTKARVPMKWVIDGVLPIGYRCVNVYKTQSVYPWNGTYFCVGEQTPYYIGYRVYSGPHTGDSWETLYESSWTEWANDDHRLFSITPPELLFNENLKYTPYGSSGITYHYVNYNKPVITSVYPEGNGIVITGTDFGQPNVTCPVISYNDTVIYCAQPNVSIRVTTSGQLSNLVTTLLFSVTPALINATGSTLVITGVGLLNPVFIGKSCAILFNNYTLVICNISAGTGTVPITINGQNHTLKYGPSITSVNVMGYTLIATGVFTYDMMPSANCLNPVWNLTTLLCNLSQGQGYSKISVSLNDTYNEMIFRFNAPIIQSVTWMDGLFAIQGKYFGTSPVTSCSIVYSNDTTILCIPGHNDVFVTSVDQTSNHIYLITRLDSLTTDNSTLTITGIGLLDVNVSTGVLFNNYTQLTCVKNATIYLTMNSQSYQIILEPSIIEVSDNCVPFSVSPTLIECTLIPGHGYSEVTVFSGDTSDTIGFLYDPPRLNSINPSLFPTTGGSITLHGANFGLNPITQLSIISHNDTTIVAIVPEGRGFRSIDVNSSASLVFSYRLPHIESMFPMSGDTDTLITLTGTNFFQSQLQVNQTNVTSLFQNHTIITFRMPQLFDDSLISLDNSNVTFGYAPRAIYDCKKYAWGSSFAFSCKTNMQHVQLHCNHTFIRGLTFAPQILAQVNDTIDFIIFELSSLFTPIVCDFSIANLPFINNTKIDIISVDMNSRRFTPLIDTLVIGTSSDVILTAGVTVSGRATLSIHHVIDGLIYLNVLTICIPVYLVILPGAFHDRQSENHMYGQLAINQNNFILNRRCLSEDRLLLQSPTAFQITSSPDYDVNATSAHLVELELLVPDATILVTNVGSVTDRWCKKPTRFMVRNAVIYSNILSVFFNESDPVLDPLVYTLACENGNATLELLSNTNDMANFRIRDCDNTNNSVFSFSQNSISLTLHQPIQELSSSCEMYNHTHLLITTIYSGDWILHYHDPCAEVHVRQNTIVAITPVNKFYFGLDLLSSETRLLEWQTVFCYEVTTLKTTKSGFSDLSTGFQVMIILCLVIPFLIMILYSNYVPKKIKRRK